MENSKSVSIPTTYRPFLIFLTVYKINRFRTTDRCTLIRNICQATGVTLLLIIFVCLYLSYELTVCIRERFNLNVISPALSFFLGSSQMVVIYFLLIFKSNEIIDVIEHINEIVKKRTAVMDFFMVFEVCEKQ